MNDFEITRELIPSVEDKELEEFVAKELRKRMEETINMFKDYQYENKGRYKNTKILGGVSIDIPFS